MVAIVMFAVRSKVFCSRHLPRRHSELTFLGPNEWEHKDGPHLVISRA